MRRNSSPPRLPRRHVRFAGAVSACLLIAACERGPTDSESVAVQLSVLSGDSQVAPAGTTLPAPLSVRALDAGGRPVANARIEWSVEEPFGFVGASSSPIVTDGSGVARAQRTLGRDAGVYTTTATLERRGAAAVQFTSIATVQGGMRMSRNPGSLGSGQTDTVGATIAEPYSVRVVDHLDQPVAGVVVSWRGVGGSVSVGTSTTDADGVARATFTLGTRTGAQTIWATVPGLLGSPVEFEAIARPGNPVAIAAVGGGDQIGRIGASLLPYTVSVLDAHGNPVPDSPIEWAVASGGGSLAQRQSATAPADSAGPHTGPIASAIHTLGPGEGEQSVTATATAIAGAPHVTFSAHAVTAVVRLDAADYYSCFYYGYCLGAFAPAEVTVPVGRTVGWTWARPGQCDIIFEDDPQPPVSSPLKGFGRHLRTFHQPGSYRYRCTLRSKSFEEGMVGVVIVQ